MPTEHLNVHWVIRRQMIGLIALSLSVWTSEFRICYVTVKLFLLRRCQVNTTKSSSRNKILVVLMLKINLDQSRCLYSSICPNQMKFRSRQLDNFSSTCPVMGTGEQPIKSQRQLNNQSNHPVGYFHSLKSTRILYEKVTSSRGPKTCLIQIFVKANADIKITTLSSSFIFLCADLQQHEIFNVGMQAHIRKANCQIFTFCTVTFIEQYSKEQEQNKFSFCLFFFVLFCLFRFYIFFARSITKSAFW